MDLKKSNNTPEISIGLPVYNGEKFIANAIESLLAQTFRNFELIISDNASTDLTAEICKKYEIDDERIRYFRQIENHDVWWNFNFVLEKAVSEYFMWAGSDDIWHPEFLEKNFNCLELNKNFVGSISEIEFYYNHWSKKDFGKFKNIKVDKKFQLVHPIKGKYKDKVKFVFDFNHPQCVYALYRTKAIKKAMIKKRFPSCDYAVILNLLKQGELNVLDQLLMYMYRGHKEPGSEKYLYSSLRKQNFNIFWSLFPFIPLTLWCMKNLGFKIFADNMFRFIKMNYRALRLIVLEKIRKNN